MAILLSEGDDVCFDMPRVRGRGQGLDSPDRS